MQFKLLAALARILLRQLRNLEITLFSSSFINRSSSMKRRQLLQLSALGAMPASLGLVQSAFAQASGPIQFGCPVPMSGAFAANGKYADLGMKLAIEQYGKVLNRSLAYTVLDTEGKPATAVRKVQESSQQHGTRFFVGGILSSESLAMGKEA